VVVEDLERSAAERRQPTTAKYERLSNQPTTDARADTDDEVDAIRTAGLAREGANRSVQGGG
jgi:hypothetical protein